MRNTGGRCVISTSAQRTLDGGPITSRSVSQLLSLTSITNIKLCFAALYSLLQSLRCQLLVNPNVSETQRTATNMSTGSGTSGRIIHQLPLSNHASSINAPVFGSPTAISCSHSLSHSQPSHLNNSIPSTSGNTTNVKKRSASRNQTPLLARSGKLAGTLNQQLYTDLVESQAAELAEVKEEVRTLRQVRS